MEHRDEIFPNGQNEPSEPRPPHPPHGPHDGPPPEPPRHGTGRVVTYFVILIVLNVLLAVYALYMLGFALTYDWTSLSVGSLHGILETLLQLLLLFSPVILTIIINRLLYRAFRGRGRFPKGTWLIAVLAIIVVQAAAIVLIFGYGFVDGTGGFNIESISQLPAD